MTSNTVELTSLTDIINVEGDLNASCFKQLQQLFNKVEIVHIHQYGNIKEQKAKITYVGPRFANALLATGATISLNYGSILARGNSKEAAAACNISI